MVIYKLDGFAGCEVNCTFRRGDGLAEKHYWQLIRNANSVLGITFTGVDIYMKT
jgi:hypothetical protein